MQIRVNGERMEFRGETLVELVGQMGIDRRFLVVEHNGEPVGRERFGELRISEGDSIELVRPVAGG